MKICLSIAPTSLQAARDEIEHPHSYADLIEIRVDGLSNINMAELLRRPRAPVIITNRISEEGGKFRGNAREEFEILSQAAKNGAEYIDIEWKWGKSFIDRLRLEIKSCKLIISHHNMEKTPQNLKTIYNNIKKTKPDIIKIAARARTISDNIKFFDLLSLARKDKRQLSALCMGEYGQISRILSGMFGSAIIYASKDDSTPTAPGQISIDELQNVFHVSKLDASTNVFGLVGNPVNQSKGIYYHNAVFQKKGVNAVYVNFLADNIGSFVEKYRNLVRGLSVTMPFKKEIVSHLDEITGNAKTLGVVNTVVKHNNKLIGYNTDYMAVELLLQSISGMRKKHVVILGTGSVAKTMATAALARGSEVTIVGRSLAKAQALATELRCGYDVLEELSSFPCDILMNATPSGMVSSPDRMIIPRGYLRKNMVVFDAVYAPEITPLLKQALETGCKIITGVQFFHRQANLQSKLFIDAI
ncbi:MAG: type I 3-dehydroquinate dehydratase [Bacteroidota bacterium]